MPKATILYDAGCRFCTRSKRLGERLDWLGRFQWTPSPQRMGAIVLLDGPAEHRGWRAIKRMALWTPATYLAAGLAAALLIALGLTPPLALAATAAALALIFSPLSNPFGDPAYAWVARNRLRLMGEEQCEWKPPSQETR